MARSSIEWTESTWNPVTGCDKISAGCKFCYAEVMAKRLQGMGAPNYRTGFQVALHPEMLERPLTWMRPQRIFVNSMSDLFHESVPVEFIRAVFEVMLRADWHQFQILTKRARRLEELSRDLPWPRNVWMGVSVENRDHTVRIDHLRRTHACVKFLSLEPLLGPLAGLELGGIDWVIVGGESGRRPRPMRAEWVVDIRDQCAASGVPFFFKQWGGVSKKKTGRLLLGRTWDGMPNVPEARIPARPRRASGGARASTLPTSPRTTPSRTAEDRRRPA
jgi:protein gp37